MTQPLPTPASDALSRSVGPAGEIPAWTDAEMVARLRMGDEPAFDTLMREMGPRLCAFATRYVGSDDVAQEIVQDVFVNVWMGRHGFVVRDTLRTYLYRAVRNRALNVGRDGAIRGGALARIGVEVDADRERGDALAEPEWAMQEAQLASAVRRAVAALPPRCRVAFELVREHGLSYAEAASVLGVTVKTVDSSLGRAVQALRKALAGVWP